MSHRVNQPSGGSAWSIAKWLVGVAAVLLVCWGLYFWFLGSAVHAVAALLASWFVYIAILLGAFIIGALLVRIGNGRGNDVDLLGFVVWVGGLIAVFCLGFYGSYASARSMYEAQGIVERSDAIELSFEPRAAYDVANAVSARNLGDTSGDASSNARAVPGRGVWSVTVDRRGFNEGYESIQQMKLPLYGTAGNQDVRFCRFDAKAGKRLSGFAIIGNSLRQSIMVRTSPTTSFSDDDARFVCDNDTPIVYVPLTKLSGLIFPYRVPAGVAVYNGRTGELDIRDTVDDATLPLYPQSVAAAQRESLKASGSFWDWLFNRAGLEDTSGDQEDPNSGNSTEITIRNADDKNTYYVTPLTPRGSSSSIVAVGTIPAASTTPGRLAPLTVHRYADGQSHQANSAVEQNIMTLMTKQFGAAQDLTLFEIVPSENGTWTASIGRSQSILYRAVISNDGSIKLTDSNGDVVAETDSNGTEKPTTPSDGDSGSQTPATLPTPSKPLDQMSPDELNTYARQLLDEVRKVNEQLAQRAQNRD